MVVLFSALAACIAAVACVRAQENSTAQNNDTTIIEDEITIHTVTVGKVPHEFHPNSIAANPGDKVMFQFYPGNHSVIESLYQWPCIPRGAVIGQPGFDSPGQPVRDEDHPTTWNLTITHTDPIYYYCGAPGSCVTHGMLGVINPASEENITAQIEMAKRERYVLYPGETLEPDARSSLSAVAQAVLAESGDDTNSNHGSHGLSGGAIAGIAIGAVAGLAIIGALLFYFGRNRGQLKALQQTLNRGGAATQATSAPPPEMTVDGVTYVPAMDPRASMAQHSFLPPYQHYPPDSRSKSPETISSHGHSTHVPSNYVPYSPQMNAQNRYSEQSDLGYQPPTRHELHAQPSIPEHEASDMDARPRFL